MMLYNDIIKPCTWILASHMKKELDPCTTDQFADYVLKSQDLQWMIFMPTASLDICNDQTEMLLKADKTQFIILW